MTSGPDLRIARLVATGFGVGFLWPAPGTWGSLLGLALFVPLVPLGWQVQLALVAALTVIGVVAADAAAPGLGGDDPSAVVIDEWAAMWLALVGIQGTLGWVLAFFLFRFFDIVKPFPARRAESLPGGVGIMADDLIAAGYTQLSVRAFLIWWGS